VPATPEHVQEDVVSVLHRSQSAACRDVTHVTHNLTFWEPAPRRLQVEGRVIRLDGFRTHDPLLITLFDSSGREHIDILVVPPESDADLAERVLRLAGGVGSTERPARILELAAAATSAPSGPA
jgi:hypothetical protein